MSKLSDRAAKRAAEFASRAAASPEPSASLNDAAASPATLASRILPVASPRQTKGASEAVAFTIASAPIKQTIAINLTDLHVRPGYERDPGEFDGPEFQELVDSIRSHGLNHQPIDVRQVRGPQHPTLYQIIAGERRFRALMLLNDESKKASELDPVHNRVAFRTALCAVREIDDQTADRIHDEENAKRAAKRPFSLAKQLSTMMKSGRYSSQADLAQKLGRNAGDISRLLRLYDEAPSALWSKIKDPSALQHRDTTLILKAYQKPAFSDWARHLDLNPVTPLSTVIKKAKELTARPKAEKTTVDKIREVERGDNFHIVLPKAIPSEVRAKILAYAKGLVSS